MTGLTVFLAIVVIVEFLVILQLRRWEKETIETARAALDAWEREVIRSDQIEQELDDYKEITNALIVGATEPVVELEVEV